MLVVTFGRDDLVPLHVPETAASHLCNWSRIFTPTFAKQTCKSLAHGVSPPGPESCVPVHVTGDPHDEEAWGFRARPAANALWEGAGGALRGGRPGAVRRGPSGARHPERGVLGAGLLPTAVSARGPRQFP